MSSLTKILKCERGESGIGLIVSVLIIGTLIALVTGMQTFFEDGKEAKMERRVLSHNAEAGKNLPVHRAPTGYQVKY